AAQKDDYKTHVLIDDKELLSGSLNPNGVTTILQRLLVSLIAMLWASSAPAANLSSGDASSHVGEIATVCGVVASTKYSTRSQSQPTFLDLDKPYPEEPFTVVIFGIDRAKFGQPEVTFQGKRVCVTGKIELYKGKPEVIVHDPSQITQ